jgi:hypothetical protein
MDYDDEQYLERAHDRSFRNKECIEKSTVCGCFFCLRHCRPIEVIDYIRREDTALCPHCGIDSLIGDASELPVSDTDFLLAMCTKWFDYDGTDRL